MRRCELQGGDSCFLRGALVQQMVVVSLLKGASVPRLEPGPPARIPSHLNALLHLSARARFIAPCAC